MYALSDALGLLLDGPVTLASAAVPSAYDCPHWPTDELSYWMFSFENTPFVVTAIVTMLVFISHDIVVPCISLMVMVDGTLINPLLLSIFRQFGPQGEHCAVYGYTMPEAIIQRYSMLITLGILVGIRQKAIPSFFTLLPMGFFTQIIFMQAVYKGKAYPHQALSAVLAGMISAIIQLWVVTKLLRLVGDFIVNTFPINWLFSYHNDYVKDPDSNFSAALGPRVPSYLGGTG